MMLTYYVGGMHLGTTHTLEKKEEIFLYVLLMVTYLFSHCLVRKIVHNILYFFWFHFLDFSMGSLPRFNPCHPYGSCRNIIGIGHKDRGETYLALPYLFSRPDTLL